MLCQPENKGFSLRDVLTLIRDWSHSPLRVAEHPIFTRTLIPTSIIGVQVHKMDFVRSAFGHNEEPGGAVKKLYAEPTWLLLVKPFVSR